MRSRRLNDINDLTSAERAGLTAAIQRMLNRCTPDGDCLIDRSGDYGTVVYFDLRPLAHRAAYLLAHGPIRPGQVVRHTCDNKRCRAAKHLVLGTEAQNCLDRTQRGGYPEIRRHGENHPRAVLTAEVVKVMRQAARAGVSIASIARTANVSASAAGDAIHGRSWSHIGEPPVPQVRRQPKPINEAGIEHARRLQANGLSLQQIADELGVSRLTAWRWTTTRKAG